MGSNPFDMYGSFILKGGVVHSIMWRGRPSTRVLTSFFLAESSSLHTVPLEIPILAPTCSWWRSRRSASLSASYSARSRKMGSLFRQGSGISFFTFDSPSIRTRFGILPSPFPHLWCHLCLFLLICVYPYYVILHGKVYKLLCIISKLDMCIITKKR